MVDAEEKHVADAEDRRDPCTREACAMRRAMEEQGRELERVRKERDEARTERDAMRRAAGGRWG